MNVKREWSVAGKSLFLMLFGAAFLTLGQLSLGALVTFLCMVHLWISFRGLAHKEIVQARRDLDQRLWRFIQLQPHLTAAEKAVMIEKLFET
jgi:hypothetical protein